MIKHNLIQGSQEWHDYRATHDNASELPIVAGESAHKSRSQYIKEKATGICEEIDSATQGRFDDGHRFEALARPIAEQFIDDDLYPVTGSDGRLSASLDGRTLCGSIIWEHKTLNDSIRAALHGVETAANLPLMYRLQMEQQLLVFGAEKCLFSATKWDGDELIEERHAWYFPDMELRAKIPAIWEQFHADAANYQHVEAAPEVVAAPVQDLPALSIQVNGSISLISNLQKFGTRLTEFVSTINKEPSDDQGFADAESAIKTLQNAQDALEAAEANALAQTADIDDMRKTVKLYADTARTTRLMLEKMVKARKESIRIEIVTNAKNEFGEHCFLLMKEIKPIVLNIDTPDFAGAIKGKKTIASLREAAGTALRNGKMEADTLAADIRAKLSWCKESSDGFGFLFADLQSIITSNGLEAFQAIVQRRIDDHKAAEAAKLEAQRIAMQAAATAKAERESAEKLAEAEAKLRAAQAEEDALVDSIWNQARRVEGDSVQYVNKAIIQFETVAKDWESDPRPRVASAIADARQQLAEKLRAADERAQVKARLEEQARLVHETEERRASEERKMVIELTEAQQIEERRRIAQCKEQERPTAKVVQIKATRPTDSEVINSISEKFDISYGDACDWIIEISHNIRSAA